MKDLPTISVWKFTILFDKERGEWGLQSFPGTSCQLDVSDKGKRAALMMLMDNLAAIFTVDNGCTDEGQFWNIVDACKPDLRHQRDGKINKTPKN